MRGRPLQRLLFFSYLLLALLGLVVVIGYTSVVVRDSYEQQTYKSLESNARLFAEALSEKPEPLHDRDIQQLALKMGQVANVRFTVVRADGEVVADTRENPAIMDNHSSRSEIQAALREGKGLAIRPSPTLGPERVYFAIVIETSEDQQLVVRASEPLRGLEEAISAMRKRIILGGFVVIAIIAVLSLLVSRLISQPIREACDGAERFSRGDFNYRIAVYGAAEVRELAVAMNHMANELQQRIETITEQQDQMTAMFSSMTEGFVLLDDEGRIVQINQSAERILGVDLVKALGSHIYELIRQPDFLRFIENLMDGNSIVEADLEAHVGGDEQVIRARGRAIMNPKGERTGALIALYNLTRLTRLESMRKDFVANVSHELNTPVTAISVAAETLADGAIHEPEMGERFVSTILQNSKRLSSLIDDLLALGRLEEEVKEDAVRLEKKPLLPTVRRAVEQCEGQAQGKQIQIKISLDPAIEVWQNGRLLQRAIHNLIDNAVRHSPAGTHVEINAEKTQPGRVVLRVADDGPGIPTEHLDRLFERFYRVDNSRSRQVGGTGLGLALVKYIALAHHGQADVESTPGQGSTFSILLQAGDTV